MKKQNSAWSLKNEIFTLIFAFRDDKTPLLAKLTTFLSLAYLVSPVDLLPDVVPFAGYLDDLIVVPVLLHLSNLLLPREVKERSLAKALKHKRQLYLILIGIVVLVLAIIGSSIYFLFYHHR